jgi:magnesium transporter
LDGLNDEIVPLLDELGDRLDQIEDRVIDTPDEQTADDIFSLRRDLIAVRRFALPQAEAIGRLARVTTELVPAEDHVLFRDVYDHIYRLSEVTESYRQLADSAYDSYLSRREDETNRRITLLTMVSAISLPITVLAGIYGMNFRYMPELTNRWAYPAFWAVVVVLVVVQMLIFRRWGWIGHRGRGRPGRR